MKHKIIGVQKQITPFGNGLEQIQIVFDCNLFDMTYGVVGKRYTSKGNFIPANPDNQRLEMAIKEELIYMRYFLGALGFDADHVEETINSFLGSEM